VAVVAAGACPLSCAITVPDIKVAAIATDKLNRVSCLQLFIV
jgi:hypothetical protein